MTGYKDETVGMENEFKKAFKRYRNYPTSDSEIIDFDKPDAYPVQRRSVSASHEDEETRKEFESLHLKWPSSSWDFFQVSAKPGLLFLRNPFTTPAGHFHWTRRCLVDYSQWPHSITNLGPPKTADNGLSILDDKKLLKKLRWVTLGYHHNWDTKVYNEENKCDVPKELQRLSSVVAQAIFGENMDFNAEAIIVNFYRMNSTLAGHVDNSERDLQLPLLSFSFGQSAIFLIGGKNVDEVPLALKIRSGDIVVMHGECRLAYHAVPRIFSDRDQLIESPSTADDNDAIVKYFQENRINMNVRQVNG